MSDSDAYRNARDAAAAHKAACPRCRRNTGFWCAEYEQLLDVVIATYDAQDGGSYAQAD